MDEHFGEGNEVYLSGVLKHLKHNDGGLKPAANNLNESGNTAKTVGVKSLVIKGLHLAPKDWRNKSKESVQYWNYSVDVTIPKFPLTVGRGFASHDIKKVVYIGDLNQIGLVDGYVSKGYKDYDACTGYKLVFQADDGMAQRNSEGNLSGNEDSNSSSDSNNKSDNDKGLEYNLDNNGNSEGEEGGE
eukprot:jgi/Psemu1/4346/gm1.4346_g